MVMLQDLNARVGNEVIKGYSDYSCMGNMAARNK